MNEINNQIAPAKLDTLPERQLAFVLGMIHGNCVPSQVDAKHPWVDQKNRGGFDQLSPSGWRRLCELEARGHASAIEEGRQVSPQHWRQWAKRAGTDLMTPELTSP